MNRGGNDVEDDDNNDETKEKKFSSTPCVYVNGKRHALRDGIGETTLLEFLRGLFSRFNFCFVLFVETTRFLRVKRFLHSPRLFSSLFLLARVHV
jgi:hypothetical protein